MGKLVTRVTNDTNAISMMFSKVLATLIKNMTVVLGVLCSMLILNYVLTLVILCFVPFVLLFTVIFRKFSRRAHRKVSDTRTELNTFLSENLSGMKITQIFNREQEKMDVFLEKSKALQKAKLGRMFVFGIFRPMIYMVHVAAVMCLLYLGGRGYIYGQPILGLTMSSGIIVSFYMYASKFFDPIETMAEHFDTLQSAFASAEKIISILELEPEVVDSPDAIELETIRGEIEFEDVWFAYEPDEWVLRGVSFHVSPQQTVAFVGSTGSGKTTILSLICRNYDIQKGQILIDGIDIRRIKISCLRRHFGQMLQDVFLFSGTIRSNILLRMEGVSDGEIMDSCRYVNADSFIDKLEGGLDGSGPGQQLLCRSAPAAELRSYHPPQALGDDSGRGHRQHRHGDRGAHSGFSGEDEEYRHHADRGSQTVHHPACGQHYPPVPRPDPGAGHPSAAIAAEGKILQSLYPPIPQTAAEKRIISKPATFVAGFFHPRKCLHNGPNFCIMREQIGEGGLPMAKLYFKYGAMGSSKTAQALITKYNYEENDLNVWLMKPSADARDGDSILRSRIGLQSAVDMIPPETDIYDLFSRTRKDTCDVIIVDECQFMTPEQIDQLRFIVNDFNIPVMCFGLRTDFQTKLFPGSLRLMEVADTIQEIKTICDCGAKATVNARIDAEGHIITEGAQVVLGGNDSYIAMCHKCYIQGIREHKKIKLHTK